jgi:cobalt-zinc-cadmium efflux system outer membrane protein
MSIGRTPPGAYQRRDVLAQGRPDLLAPAPTIPDFPLENPAKVDTGRSFIGEPGGMTLEEAVDRLSRCNPAVSAARSETDQARSDTITAGLRTNPQFFADMQQVPYRVLAPGQADVNFAYPVDVSGKRSTRVKSAVCVLRSVEWKYTDFVRTQVDNLNTLFVDTLVAQEMVRAYSKAGPEALQVPRFRFDVTQSSGPGRGRDPAAG